MIRRYDLFQRDPSHVHSVWKSQKKSHSTLRAKRARFTFWVGKSKSIMPTIINFGEFLKMRHFWWFSNNVEIYFTRGAAIISVRFHALMLLHHFHRFSPLLLIFFQKKNKQRKSLIENALKFSFAAILSGVRRNLTLFFH